MLENKKRILIVDDEEDLTWSISRGLIKDKNALEVMCANSGYHALKTLSEHSVDLLVTDLRMPGVDGFCLLNEVMDRYPKTRVIVMTAHGSQEVKDRLRTRGEPGYIEKPFEINDLRKLIYDRLEINATVI